MILVKMRCNISDLALDVIGPPRGIDSNALVVFAAPDDVKPTFEQISANSGVVATKRTGANAAGWCETSAYVRGPIDPSRYDKLPLFVPGWDAALDATPLCQACELYGEHHRCTGETTLGTKACGCPCRAGRQP